VSAAAGCQKRGRCRKLSFLPGVGRAHKPCAAALSCEHSEHRRCKMCGSCWYVWVFRQSAAAERCVRSGFVYGGDLGKTRLPQVQKALCLHRDGSCLPRAQKSSLPAGEGAAPLGAEGSAPARRLSKPKPRRGSALRQFRLLSVRTSYIPSSAR